MKTPKKRTTLKTLARLSMIGTHDLDRYSFTNERIKKTHIKQALENPSLYSF